MKKLNIGLFGFGVVGEGIYTILSQSQQLQCHVKRVCIKHPEKQRNAPAELFTQKAQDILQDPEIDTVVELISDADAAYDIVCKAFAAKKNVVSANKKLIAEHLPYLLDLAQNQGVSFLYEASVCGSVPIIRNLEEYFDNDWLQGIYGIVNGSTNFILSQLFKKGLSYPQALKLAQENGFAEADPQLDVEGFDAAFKLCLLTYHAYGIYLHPHEIFRIGITRISAFDAQYAKEKNLSIKFIAYADCNDQNEVFVHLCPSLIPSEHPLAQVENEYNSVIVHSAYNTEQQLTGKGAGRFPTASAVLSDISALSYHYQYAYKKAQAKYYRLQKEAPKFTWYLSSSKEIEGIDLEVIERYHSQQGSYCIVQASTEELKEKGILDQTNVSIIKLWDKA